MGKPGTLQFGPSSFSFLTGISAYSKFNLLFSLQKPPPHTRIRFPESGVLCAGKAHILNLLLCVWLANTILCYRGEELL